MSNYNGVQMDLLDEGGGGGGGGGHTSKNLFLFPICLIAENKFLTHIY